MHMYFSNKVFWRAFRSSKGMICGHLCFKLLTSWTQKGAEIVCIWSGGIYSFYSFLCPRKPNFPWDHAVVFLKPVKKATQIGTKTLSSAFLMSFSSPLFPLQMLRCTLYRNTKPWIMSSEIYCTFLHSLTSRDLLCLCLFLLVCLPLSSLAAFLF